jgi:hypothetical protein
MIWHVFAQEFESLVGLQFWRPLENVMQEEALAFVGRLQDWRKHVNCITRKKSSTAMGITPGPLSWVAPSNYMSMKAPTNEMG